MKREWPGEARKVPLRMRPLLGSALALLAFARFLKSPEDLGNDIELRDFYGFGTLRLGDADFVSTFENLTLSPRNRPNLAWRVQNRLDLATAFPFGAADVPQLRSVLSTSSLVNYGHVSASLVLRPILAIPGSTYRLDKIGSFRGATEVKVVTDALGLHEAKPSDRTRPWWKDSARFASIYADPSNPVRWGAALFGLVAPMIYDHAPSAYFHSLNAIGHRPSLDAAGEPAAAIPARLEAAIETETSTESSSSAEGDELEAEGFELVEQVIEEAVQEAVEEVLEEAAEIMLAAAAAAPAHAPAYVPVFIAPVAAAGQAAAERAARAQEVTEGEEPEEEEEQEVEAKPAEEGKGKKDGGQEGGAYPSPPGSGETKDVTFADQQQEQQKKDAAAAAATGAEVDVDAEGAEKKNEKGDGSAPGQGLPTQGW